MTGFFSAPRVSRGALIGVDRFNPLASAVLFQYNPAEMTRSLAAAVSPSEKRGEPYRGGGPPRETISMTVELNAADQLEKSDSAAVRLGIYPQLSALEMLLYPKSAGLLANAILAQLGSIEVLAPEAPMTLLIWGAQRVLPVRLTTFTISETLHDRNLNPILASIELIMEVLNTNDFDTTHPGYYVFLSHQIVKEVMATLGGAANARSLL
jgi:hypothetical protein